MAFYGNNKGSELAIESSVAMHNLAAGGPGSGRHSTSYGKFTGYHAKLLSKGFSPAPTKGMERVVGLPSGSKAYNHPNGDQVAVHKDGSWDHSNEDGSKVKEGSSTKELLTFLDKTYKGKNIKAKGGFQPDGGRKKFKVGDKVTTSHGEGKISEITAKDHVQVTHTSGKVSILHHSKVTKCKEVKAGGPGSGRKPDFGNKGKEKLNQMHSKLTKQGFDYKKSTDFRKDVVGKHHDPNQIVHLYKNSDTGREAFIQERTEGTGHKMGKIKD